MGVSVLILSTDLYHRIGGGEAVYRRLIANNPEIDFYFFETSKNLNKNLPKNAHSLKLGPKPRLESIEGLFDGLVTASTKDILNQNQINAAELAEQYARSARNLKFDIVDVPEYEIVGGYLRGSLNSNKITFKLITTFIHGSLSLTLDFENTINKNNVEEIVKLEEIQRRASNYFFILDDWYPNKLQISREKRYHIDPWQFVNNDSIKTNISNTRFISQKNDSEPPKIFFFGRWEKRKGLDLLPEIIKLIPSWSPTIVFAGDKSNNRELYKQVRNSSKIRNLRIEELDTTDAKYLYKNIRNCDILVLPSHFDSFNLIALEAIALGKRVAISNQCGAFHFLREKHPNISFIEIDPNDLSLSAQNLSAALLDDKSVDLMNDKNRVEFEKIWATMERNQFTIILNEIMARELIQTTYQTQICRFGKYSFKRAIRARIQNTNPLRILFKVMKAVVLHRRKLNSFIHANRFIHFVLLFMQSSFIASYFLQRLDRDRRIIYLKPKYFSLLGNNESISIEKRLTYAIRSYRFSGYDSERFNLENLVSGLESIGMNEEAVALNLLNDFSGKHVLTYLESRRIKFRELPAFTFNSATEFRSRDLVDDPKISIIVSSFNASPKMEEFFTRLSLCPEVANGRAEILLIDANSPLPDSSTALRLAKDLGIILRVIRVDKRITIQEAWNLGISESRGEFLSFLGVDETVYPEGFTRLADALENDISIDWVMGNSIVAEVGMEGRFTSDIMFYDRNGANEVSAYLETCYVSYVAGMYRKSIHSRFGYYDPTFKGAGDTEFKSRVLPSIKVGFLNETLGEFLNYPEERTTGTEKIELEDIRAWYIFRTPGGLRYQASLAGTGFYENMAMKSFAYRKSFCDHISTDLEIASAIYSAVNADSYALNSQLYSQLEEASTQLNSLRVLLGYRSKSFLPMSYKRFKSLVRWFDVEGRKSAIRGAGRLRFDNIFEQHIWYW